MCVCVCVNLINDWQWSPAALVMCLDQCYKQGVKGLPSASHLNDWPLVQLDGWKCSNINDHVPRRPVARWNEQRSPQRTVTINGPEPACLPFVITYPTCGPPLNTCWTCRSINTECSRHWFGKKKKKKMHRLMAFSVSNIKWEKKSRLWRIWYDPTPFVYLQYASIGETCGGLCS